jgi:hypothetical protein
MSNATWPSQREIPEEFLSEILSEQPLQHLFGEQPTTNTKKKKKKTWRCISIIVSCLSTGGTLARICRTRSLPRIADSTSHEDLVVGTW